ncbi:hypothetical protein WISP_00986 [Willisornis vidua]|uniref:Uncharacterized protein n=1 Tax=Willisornis vidua TaxID=1566151 RepID=A0ABQ9E0R1_9PASS|nr:hypothetical protein WISP_00986 [Willisornis vidua]
MAAPPLCLRLAAAAAYGLSSFLIVVVNKSVLTTYGFPSSLCVGLGQVSGIPPGPPDLPSGVPGVTPSSLADDGDSGSALGGQSTAGGEVP